MYWTILLSVMMVALLQLVSYTRLKQNVLVVLGSADDRILSERVSAAIEYIESNEDQSIILFISGGVKNAIVNESSDRGETEASKAASSFDYENVKIVLDEKATNTAENFAYLKRWVNNNYSSDEMPSIVITTSDFHQDRAELIFQGIMPEITPQWNLSKSSCTRCWSDEMIHIKNVQSDIMKAIHIVQ
jgi:uncharacterized SAM-binding protein YcdF (DUF218 family)